MAASSPLAVKSAAAMLAKATVSKSEERPAVVMSCPERSTRWTERLLVRERYSLSTWSIALKSFSNKVHCAIAPPLRPSAEGGRQRLGHVRVPSRDYKHAPCPGASAMTRAFWAAVPSVDRRRQGPPSPSSPLAHADRVEVDRPLGNR